MSHEVQWGYAWVIGLTKYVNNTNLIAPTIALLWREGGAIRTAQVSFHVSVGIRTNLDRKVLVAVVFSVAARSVINAPPATTHVRKTATNGL
jgi:hypothetical protein